MPTNRNFSGVIAPVLTPYRRGRQSRSRALRRSCALAARPGLHGAGSVRYDERGELARARRAAGAARGADRQRHRSGHPDAGHRHVLGDRCRDPDRARRRGRLRRLPDAAAVLLQGHERGGAVPLLRPRDRGGRQRRSVDLSLSHSAGGPGRLPAAADHAAEEGVPRGDPRHEGFLRRLVEHGCRHEGAPRARVLPGLRDAPAAGPARGCCRRDLGDRQRQPRPDARAVRFMAAGQCRRAAGEDLGAAYTPCRPIR